MRPRREVALSAPSRAGVDSFFKRACSVVRSSSVSLAPAWISRKRERFREVLLGRKVVVGCSGREDGVGARGGRRADVGLGGGVMEAEKEEGKRKESFAVAAGVVIASGVYPSASASFLPEDLAFPKPVSISQHGQSRP